MLRRWSPMKDNDKFVVLYYAGKEKIIVLKTDFDRAFGTILNSSYEDVKKSFAVN